MHLLVAGFSYIGYPVAWVNAVNSYALVFLCASVVVY